MIRHISRMGVAVSLVLATPIVAQPVLCGLSVDDWCPAPIGDRCGRHKNTASCKADPSCYGMPYRGESFAACIFDTRGFAFNCPAVGCTSTPPAMRGRRNSATRPQ
jgi:hypothetical protein